MNKPDDTEKSEFEAFNEREGVDFQLEITGYAQSLTGKRLDLRAFFAPAGGRP